MNIYGDVKLTHTHQGGQLTWIGGQPEMDAGLWTSVYLSLFTDSGFWGAPALGSALHDLSDATLTNQVRLRAVESARLALAWLVTEGIAESVTVVAEIPGPSRLDLLITITEPGSGPVTYRYSQSWRATQEAL